MYVAHRGVAHLEDETDLQHVDAAKPFSLPNLPYAHYIRRFPTSLSSSSTSVDELYDTLREAFMTLLDLVILAVRHDPADHPRGPPSVSLSSVLSSV